MVPDDEDVEPAAARVAGLTIGDLDELRAIFGATATTTTAIGPTGPSIRISHHDVLGRKCVSLITNGLRRLGRDEIVLTVAGDVLAQAPDAPAELIKLVASLLDNAPLLGPGALMKATHSAWPRLAGFTLERASPMPGVDLPSGCLAMHALVDNELAVVDAFGSLRVIGRLTKGNGAWPPLAVCDPWRPAVADPAEVSVVGRVTTVHAPGVTVTIEGAVIALRLSRGALLMLASLADAEPLSSYVLFATLDPHADALLSWAPGANHADANTGGRGTARRIGASFFGVAPGQPADGGGLVEDGVVMSLTTTSATAFRAALLAGEPTVIRSVTGLGLRLEWTGELA